MELFRDSASEYENIDVTVVEKILKPSTGVRMIATGNMQKGNKRSPETYM